VTAQSHWIGDLGHLALADATLGALLINMLDMLAYAGYPEWPSRQEFGLTTKQAAREVERWVEEEPELFSDPATDWLSDVIAVTDLRNALLHAVALNRCGTCGAATRFIHPRSGQEVDRSEHAVQDLTRRALELHENGKLLAEQIAERVNERILGRARLDAETTREIQNPPQVHPHHTTHMCANCTGTGLGQTIIQIQPAALVYPSGLPKFT
jgi:hypothetical protein